MADEPPPSSSGTPPSSYDTPPSSYDTPPPPASSNSDASNSNKPPTVFLRRSRSTPLLPSESFDSMTMYADSPQQITASIKGKEVATTSYSSSKPPARSKSFLQRSRSTPRLPSESFDFMTMYAVSPQQIAASIKGKAVATTSYSSSKDIKGKAIAMTSSSSFSEPTASVYIRRRSSVYIQQPYKQSSHWPSDIFPRYAAQSSEINNNNNNRDIEAVNLRNRNWTDRAQSTLSRFPQPVKDLCKVFSLSIGVLLLGYLAWRGIQEPLPKQDR